MWLQLVLLLAVLKCAAGLVGVLIGSLGAFEVAERQVPLWVLAAQIGAFSTSAGVLILRGAPDRRAVHLGTVFLLVASPFARTPVEMLVAWAPGSLLLQSAAHLHVDALFPMFLWLFFRDFPRVIGSPTTRRLTSGMVSFTGFVGVALIAANLVLLLPGTEFAQAFDARSSKSVYWVVVFGLAAPALPYALWRTRTAREAERHRVRLFVAGIGAGSAPVILFIFLVVLVPAFRVWATSDAVRPLLQPVIQVLILSIPMTTAYSVLVDRVVDVRLLVRTALQYVMAHGAVTVAATLPFWWLGWYLFRLREESLADLFGGLRPLAIVGAAGFGLVALQARRRAASAIDRTFFREAYDARQILVDLASRSRTATSAEALAGLLVRELDRALHVEACALLLMDHDGLELRTLDGRVRPLRAASDLGSRIARADGPLAVDERDPDLTSVEDKRWLADSALRLLVPLTSPTRELLGVLVLGEKRSGLPYSRDDQELLRAIAVAGSLTLENLHFRAPAHDTSSRSARECESCAVVYGEIEETCPDCGRVLTQLPFPKLLLGKFLLERRLGEGSMGVVYRAQDVELGRQVAVKTLPSTSPEESVRLRREARAMAAVVHPNLALIYGSESWKGTPFLVLELLEGATLTERIEAGAMPADDVTRIGIRLSDVLEHVHAAGMLHRDVKPSNVGFTAQGVPKLLDFGLAQLIGDAMSPESHAHRARNWLGEGGSGSSWGAHSILQSDGMVGTPLYMSPEAMRGEPPDASFDLWALATVLYEALTRRHPFEHATWPATHEAILAGRAADVRELSPDSPDRLAEFLAAALDSDRRHRPRSAVEFRRGLTAIGESRAA